jgi:hypothetical protein
METKTVDISKGTCEVRGMTSRQINEGLQDQQMIWLDYREIIAKARTPPEKEKRELERAKKLSGRYYRRLADCVVEHSFELNGQKVDVFLGELSEDDVNIIERAISELSSVTEDDIKNSQNPSDGSRQRTDTLTGLEGSSEYSGIAGYTVTGTDSTNSPKEKSKS